MNTPTRILNLAVHAVEELNPLVRKLVLRATDGRPLPGFTPGAHIRVEVRLPNGLPAWRHYSLLNFEPSTAPTLQPGAYVLAVRLESESRGGSQFMHRLRVGETLTAEAPRNDFPLGDHAGGALLVAGGIGVTPLTAMAAECRRLGRHVRMVYAGRSLDQMTFVAELRTLLADDLILHADDQAGAPLNVNSLLDGCGTTDILYVCGPGPMRDAILAAASGRGWPPDRVRFEIFGTPVAIAGDHAFDVVLQRSGETLHVPADQSILECLERHGGDPLADCRRGECGVCAVDVLEGEVDHRDHVLTAAERAGGKVIQICVSRARGSRLVLDV